MTLAGLLTLTVAGGASAQRGHGPGADLSALAGKRILLANDDSVQAAGDDGKDGRGLFVLRKALCEAKADVVVVGPWAQQGGRGRSTAASPHVTVAPPTATPAQYVKDCSTAPSGGLVVGVCQGASTCTPASSSVTPADAVEVALGAFLPQRVGWSGGPDLVLTGVNPGANTDLAANLSGTVGAATAAVEKGLPAVAVSAGTRATSVPSDDTYRTAAVFAAKVAARLFSRKAAGKLVQHRLLLNINCPDVAHGTTPSPRWTRLGRVQLDRFAYTAAGTDTYRLTFGPAEPAPSLDPRSDTAALVNGHISVGAITADRDATGDLAWLRSAALAD
ncbi:5'/3'-nucleotidase SurE [Actinomadura vinacea]|uniref:5'-nucleotidase n=1 Tax=Actinomadura vinacea TaxID=115336 RepID=A0ABP5WWF0_9ACTN